MINNIKNMFGINESNEQIDDEDLASSETLKNRVEEEKRQEEIEEEENDEFNKPLPSKDRNLRDLIAPTVFDEKEDYVKSGKEFVQTLFILNWPTNPGPLFLDEILYATPVTTDVSLHVSPREKDEAMDNLEKQLDKASAQAGQGITASSVQARQKRLENTQIMYNELQGEANLHDICMYITVRSEDPDKLKLSVENIVRALRTNGLYPEVIRKDQRAGMQSTSPIGKNILGYSTEAASGAVGAMYPFSTTTVMEPGGIDIGIHAINNSPVTINRFDRENGYNQFTSGKIGSGKTYGTLLEILRAKAAYGDDLKIFLLDPLEGFKPIINLLGGKEILVGGNVNINPMKITKTPEEVFDELPTYDPLNEKRQNLVDFAEMYFALQNRELGDSRDVYNMALTEAYKRQGITSDPDTHSNKSPNFTLFRNILEEISSEPEKFAESDSEDLINQIEKHASRLALAFNTFKEGEMYENLSKDMELNLEEEDIVYFNLRQQEGSGNLGLMMHVLLSEVYEQAKDTDKKVLFCIDESHYIMKDSRSLDFLEQVVRHSRHHDLGINFITQTIEEFFEHPQAEAIIQQCSMRRFHNIESGLNEDIMDTLSLNQAQVNFIQNAKPGSKERGYSEALYGVDEHGYVPIKIRPSDFEIAAIEMAENS